ncbi:MAG: urea ABC transporter substrate-binding protein [Acidimicrobiales bacterium]
MKRTRSWRFALAATLSLGALGLAACGGDDSGSTSEGAATESSGGEAAASGDTIKVGVLQSLSGTMSISEVAVRNSQVLAIEEINAAGGVLGKQLEVIEEDGESKPEVFAQKIDKLLNTDEVAVVFGGWTSASRKAMKPVVEGSKGLLFYPVQYEGLEVSPNIFYTGATTNQQIIPGLDYLKEEGLTKVFLVGSDYVFPRTANKEIKAYAAAEGLEIMGEEYLQLGDTNVQGVVQKVLDAKPQVVFNTLNGDTNVAFFKELKAKGNTPEQIQTISVSVAEEEVSGIGVENIEGHLVAWNYYQTTDTPENKKFVEAYKAKYGEEKNTADPIEAGYNSVYIWKAAVEKAGTVEVDKVIAAAAGLELATPEGPLTVHPKNHHVYKTARIGVINGEGLIDGCGTPASRSSPTPASTPTSGLPAWPRARPARSAARSRADGPLPRRDAEGRPRSRGHRNGAAGPGHRTGGASLCSRGTCRPSSTTSTSASPWPRSSCSWAWVLTFTFGQMGVINMAHGEFIMAGAYVPYVLQTTFLERFKGMAVLVALPLAFVVAGLMGVVLERVLLRRMRGRPSTRCWSPSASASSCSSWPRTCSRPTTKTSSPPRSCGAGGTCWASRSPTPGCSCWRWWWSASPACGRS